MALMVGAAGKAVGVEHVPQLVQTSIGNIANDGTDSTLCAHLWTVLALLSMYARSHIQDARQEGPLGI